MVYDNGHDGHAILNRKPNCKERVQLVEHAMREQHDDAIA
eukprot:CAMPEP_0119394270 /NCGR_PEP_ID=MMETSP1334-20130426/128703_1 /TAXON_ID=127549 /ORGANISM="Calcidiscus leptoporus, Strain RCC1130" /LENGTH=39 /DNA_ID= /DNA_START= /DNA_END= /DNA_ORIENTATION=